MPISIRFLRALAIGCVACAGPAAAQNAQYVTRQSADTLVVPIAADVHWWAGVIAQGDAMPLRDGYDADLAARNYGNQIQPLLLSDAGDVVWSEQPFRIRVAAGALNLTGRGPFVRTRAGTSLRDAYRSASRTHFAPSGKLPATLLFEAPQYNTWIELMYDQNQADILRYAHAVVDNGFPPGVLMIDDNWQLDYGTWRFHPGRFANPRAMVDELHKLGFEVMVWVCPFVSPDSEIYRYLRSRGFLLKEPAGDQPAIVRWWNGASALLDLSNPGAFDWFTTQLDSVRTLYGVDGFKLDAGDVDFYRNTKSFRPVTPHEQSELYGKVGLRFPLNEYRAMWKMGGQPLAERLQDKRHSWEDLRKLVPHGALMGLMGYPFTAPDMIGGGEFSSFLNLEKLDQDLVVRSAQASALMPMMQFSAAPWRVLDGTHLAAVKKSVALRKVHTPYIMQLAREAARTGEPIVRPMEYDFPHEGLAEITDQFMLGDRFLVAPVLERGATSRSVRLPSGRWRGPDGAVTSGARTVRVSAPLDVLPVFERM
jgi:alpha-glucosidase